MHLDISQEQFLCENWQEKCRAQERDNDFVRACAVEMHMDKSLAILF